MNSAKRRRRTRSSEGETMSDYIPEDILTDILARLPVKSLLRFSLVCKLWHSFISSTSFITTHLNRTITSNHTPQFLIMYDQPRCSVRYVLCNDDNTFCEDDQYVELEPPAFDFGVSYDILRIVGSCNGLLCLFRSYPEDHSFVIVLWNPSIRRHMKVPESRVMCKEVPACSRVVVGFGFDPTSNDYKLVKIVLGEDDRTLHSVDVYALSTRSWRPISFDFHFEIKEPGDSSVCVSGAVHWLGYAEPGISSVLAFDIGDEVFRVMPLPNHLATNAVNVNLSGDSLAVICDEYDDEYDPLFDISSVWVMEEYGVMESWTKRCTIIAPDEDCIRVMGLRNNGDVLVKSEEYRDLISYDPQKQTMNPFVFDGNYLPYYVVKYMESLVALDVADKVVWKSK